MLDEVNSDLEDNIGNLMNDLDTQFVLEESLENELDSDGEILNLHVPDTNYHVVENPPIEKALEESSGKAEKEVKGKRKKKIKEKKRAKEKNKGKSKDKEIKPGEIEFEWGKTCSICKGTLMCER